MSNLIYVTNNKYIEIQRILVRFSHTVQYLVFRYREKESPASRLSQRDYPAPVFSCHRVGKAWKDTRKLSFGREKSRYSPVFWYFDHYIFNL
jgi:hypothetical protein